MIAIICFTSFADFGLLAVGLWLIYALKLAGVSARLRTVMLCKEYLSVKVVVVIFVTYN